jgi:hypothetical protein
MRIFNRIIQDSKAPNTFDLWIDKGRLKYFNGGWKDLGGSEQVSWNDIQGKPNLSAVATSGSYNDLSNKPTIPPAYSLPNASASTRGGVLRAAAVADTDATGAATAQSVATTLNTLLASLRASGTIQS